MTIPPTSWTDNSLTWAAANPLWDSMSLNLAMIESVKECDSIAGRTVPALLSAAYNPIQPNRDYVNAIHSEVSTLIPLFVNHLDNSGNWNGQATIPAWTEATILTAIGDASRIVPANLNTLSAWYFQTYRILNMLRWVEYENKLSNKYFLSGIRKRSGGATTDWNTEIAQWESDAGSSIDASSDMGINRMQFSSGKYYIITEQKTFRFNTDALKNNLDIYIKPAISSGLGNNYLQPIGNVTSTAYLNLYKSLSEPSDVTIYPAGELEWASFGPPENNTSYNQIFSAITSDKIIFVLKFDGANGRKFKDW